jgi:FixJ family two-component response regulator
MPCVIVNTISELAEPERTVLSELVASHRSAQKIASALRASGLNGSASSIRNHRRRECVCIPKGA